MRDYTYVERDTSYCIRHSDPQGGPYGYYPGPGADYCWNGKFLTGASGRSQIQRGDHVTTIPYEAYRIAAKAEYYLATRRVGGQYADQLSYKQELRGTPHCTQPGLLTPFIVPKYSGNEQRQFQIQMHAPTRDRAGDSLLKKLSEVTDFQLGQTVGEVKTTSKMMNNRLLQFLKAFKALRQKKFGLAAHYLGLKNYKIRGKNVADVYLEFKFGWIQLYKDIFGGYEAIKKALSRPTDLLVHKSAQAVSYMKPPQADPWARTYVDGGVRYGVKTGCTYRVSDSSAIALNMLGIANPLALAWELLPYSFVVNWLVSVGSFLTGLSSTVGLSFVSGYETWSVKSAVTLQDYGQMRGYFLEPPSVFKCDSNAMRRMNTGAFPIPGLRMNLGLNFGQAITLIALVQQRRS